MDKLARLEALHPDIIEEFIKKGKSDAIPAELQKFILHLQWAAEINEHTGSIKRAAKKLQHRIFTIQAARVPILTCKAIIYDAKNYFCIDSNVTKKVWDLDTADKLEDLAQLAIADNKWDKAHKMIMDANKLRTRASEALTYEDFEAPVFLISPDLTPEDLGYDKKSMKEIASKANNGFYTKLINELPIENQQKKALLKDANVTDVDYEELDSQ